MKKLLLFIVILTGLSVSAQIDGLNYQAVIINPEAQELPGQDLTGNFLPRTDVQIRFTIFDATGAQIYQETQNTQTDGFGMISLTVGRGNATTGSGFNTIQWDGTPKDLKVELSIDGSFNTVDGKTLNFLPYSFHRDIFATGSMTTDGLVNFEGDLLVRGTTDLNGTLDVNNNTTTSFTGTMTVEEETLLKNNLEVANRRPTTLTGTLMVDGASALGNRLNVVGETDFNNTLEVNGGTRIENTLNVEGATTLENNLGVIEISPVLLTGDLTVDGKSNLNSTVNVNNESSLSLSGNLNAAEDILLNGNLVVNGRTNLNSSLSVNNEEFTSLSGALHVEGQTKFMDSLFVSKETNLENVLRVNNEMPTYLSGTLDVGLATNLNAALTVNNGADTRFTGPLTVQGMIDFGDELRVNGVTNLNDDLFVNNGALTNMTGPLRVNGVSNFQQTLEVDGTSTFNNNITVANASPTLLTGTLTGNGVSTLNNAFIVENSSVTVLRGDLNVDGVGTLNNEVNVTNAAATDFSGTLDVTDTTLFNNAWNTSTSNTNLTGLLDVTDLATLGTLNVANATSTRFTGIMNVTGGTTLNQMLTVTGRTLLDSDLNVTGTANLENLTTANLTVADNQLANVATFSNTNDTANSQGIIIKLGKTHPRFLNGVFIGTNQVSGNGGPSTSVTSRIKDKFLGGVPTISIGEMFDLIPDLISLGALPDINNFVFEGINAELSSVGFPSVDFPNFNFPDVPGFPGTSEPGVIFPGIEFYGGFGGGCSGQACVSVCVPFLGCATVCVPPVNICLPAIPAIGFPKISLNGFNIVPSFPNWIPSIPGFSTPQLTDINFPTLPDEIVFDALTNENKFAVFQDTDGRVLGSIKAESIQDFLGRTIDNDVYMVEVLSEFVGLDLAKVKMKAGVRMAKLVVEYNQSGIQYSSGNGDYAEWLERIDHNEYMSPGDIVGVQGGKITKDLTNAQQIMVVSNKPIVMGNVPADKEFPKGNAVAFIGQVPVKVIGTVTAGDYIIPHHTMIGYGQAVSPSLMTISQFGQAVGRSWITNTNEGPKLVNTVVGLQNGDWSNVVKTLDQNQDKLDVQLSALEVRLNAIQEKLRSTVN